MRALSIGAISLQTDTRHNPYYNELSLTAVSMQADTVKSASVDGNAVVSALSISSCGYPLNGTLIPMPEQLPGEGIIHRKHRVWRK